MCAVGYSGGDVDEKISLKIKSRKGEVVLAERGCVFQESIERGRMVMEDDTVDIHIELHKGNGRAYAMGCDLTHDYVELNSKYTT